MFTWLAYECGACDANVPTLRACGIAVTHAILFDAADWMTDETELGFV